MQHFWEQIVTGQARSATLLAVVVSGLLVAGRGGWSSDGVRAQPAQTSLSVAFGPSDIWMPSQDAITALKQVAVSEPDNDRVHYLLSAAYSKQGKREEAQLELATYQRLTRSRLQRTQQDVRDASESVAGKDPGGTGSVSKPRPPQ